MASFPGDGQLSHISPNVESKENLKIFSEWEQKHSDSANLCQGRTLRLRYNSALPVSGNGKSSCNCIEFRIATKIQSAVAIYRTSPYHSKPFIKMRQFFELS